MYLRIFKNQMVVARVVVIVRPSKMQPHGVMVSQSCLEYCQERTHARLRSVALPYIQILKPLFFAYFTYFTYFRFYDYEIESRKKGHGK